jgi:hypothetical protein
MARKNTTMWIPDKVSEKEGLTAIQVKYCAKEERPHMMFVMTAISVLRVFPPCCWRVTGHWTRNYNYTPDWLCGIYNCLAKTQHCLQRSEM